MSLEWIYDDCFHPLLLFLFPLLLRVGKYSLAAVLGTSVYVQITYQEHRFARVKNSVKSSGMTKNPGYINPQSGLPVPGQKPDVEFFRASDNIADLDFEDITTEMLTLQVAGGLCETSLGQAVIHLKRQQCSFDFKMPLTIETTQRNGIKTFALPKHQFEVEFFEIAGQKTFSELMIGYLDRVDEWKQTIDLDADVTPSTTTIAPATTTTTIEASSSSSSTTIETTVPTTTTTNDNDNFLSSQT